MSFWTRPSICTVTGASRGYGKVVSIMFAEKLPAGSILLLLARDLKGLEETATQIRSKRSDIKVVTSACDLSLADTETYENIFKQIDHLKSDALKQAIIIHNAGTLGDITKKVVEHNVTNDLSSYWKLNLTSPILITNVFNQHFGSLQHKYIVQVSSLCAVKPFKTWSLYCAGKAARDMLFRTMAFEEQSWRIVNYAPGAMDTDLIKQAKKETGDKEYRDSMNQMSSAGGLLTCDKSVAKLMALLELDEFESGSHVDIYEVHDDGKVEKTKDDSAYFVSLNKK